MSTSTETSPKKFERTKHGNFLLEIDDDSYLSYRHFSTSIFRGGSLGPDSGNEETAMKLGGVWYILNGDFRKEYTEAFPDTEKLLAVYNKHKAEHRSGWSTDEHEDIDSLVGEEE